MGNPVVRFEIGAADDQALARFYGALFGWGLQAVADGYTLVDTGGWGGDQRGDREESERGAVGDLLRGGGGPAGVPGAGGGARGRTAWPVTELPGLTFAMLEDPDGLLVGLQRVGASLGRPSDGGGAAVDWFEVLGADAGRSQAFYAELFGWAVPEGAYGQVVPGAANGIGGGIGAGGEARWATVYASVGDVEAALGGAEGLGATREYGPNQVDDHTWTGMFRDPAGNPFGVYRHGPH
jgi:predicted enzyme related to lactoylglutathione lyase